MHILIAIVTLAAGLIIWISRAQNAKYAVLELFDVANDVRLAARRFGFNRRKNQHVVASIDDPNLAIAGLAVAFLDLDGFPTAEAQKTLLLTLQSEFRIDRDTAAEMLTLGRWFVSECGGASPAIARLSGRLLRISGQKSFTPLMTVISATAKSTEGGLSERQREALEEIQRRFRIQ